MTAPTGSARVVARRRKALLLPLIAVCGLVVACSSGHSSTPSGTGSGSGTSSGGGGGGGGGGGAGSSGIVASATAAVDKGYQGYYRDPAPGPAAVKGKTVYVVTCGNVALGCYVPAQAIQTAAQTLGWKVTIVDGKLNPAGYLAGIQQAIAAHPDGIVTIGIDCSAATSAYRQAKSAGIPVVGIYVIDCNDPSVGGQQMLTSEINTGNGQDTGAWFTQWGKLHADYLIAKTDGRARVIEFAQEGFADISYIDRGFEAEMAKCTTCKIVAKQTLTPADIEGPGVVAKVSSALVAHSADANSVFFDNDTALGIAAPVLKSNPHPNWTIVGSEGLPNTLALVGTTVTGLTAYAAPWLGWCGAYTLNEVFAKHPVTDCGIGFQIVDAQHNRPAPGVTTVTPSIDYQSIMRSQWTS